MAVGGEPKQELVPYGQELVAELVGGLVQACYRRLGESMLCGR
jgi:hypothetical protein